MDADDPVGEPLGVLDLDEQAGHPVLDDVGRLSRAWSRAGRRTQAPRAHPSGHLPARRRRTHRGRGTPRQAPPEGLRRCTCGIPASSSARRTCRGRGPSGARGAGARASPRAATPRPGRRALDQLRLEALPQPTPSFWNDPTTNAECGRPSRSRAARRARSSGTVKCSRSMPIGIRKTRSDATPESSERQLLHLRVRHHPVEAVRVGAEHGPRLVELGIRPRSRPAVEPGHAEAVRRAQPEARGSPRSGWCGTPPADP